MRWYVIGFILGVICRTAGVAIANWYCDLRDQFDGDVTP